MGKSIASYVARLQALAEDCEFGDNLNEMLRDCLVCGVNNEQLQHRLLAQGRRKQFFSGQAKQLQNYVYRKFRVISGH